ncbi:hypothetical protein ABZ490_13675 [Streptomyces sp. NPDC005811]|uniref:hypothetical protein n=1 Tax=Streptomyces sp. NPDC005811 TaxID=3154565 RepID=UPI0033C3D26B
MTDYPFEKQPAFFPFVSAEVFFDAEDADDAEATAVADTGKDSALDADLDALLATI